jgi:hypothetical protein
MLGMRKQRNHRVLFNHFTVAHDHHAIGNLCHNTHVVSDKDHPHIHLFLQFANQLQNLRLNRHVKRCGGLVCNQ